MNKIMLKIYLIIFSLLLLTNCTAPGTALLGPALTGATTQSVGRAGLSYGSNKIIKELHKSAKNKNNSIAKITKKIEELTIKPKNRNFLKFHK
jgi:hypothetical protein